MTQTDAAEQRRELGTFIRLLRERAAPRALGLPTVGRRRTPGLRREELATLCHVSPTWITWLEQGRPVAPSAAVLARLAAALQLSAAQRAYLFELAKRRDPAEREAPQAGSRSRNVVRSVQLMHCPAYVLDRRWDVVAANAGARDLFLDWGRKPRAGAPNLLRFLFLDRAARSLVHDWPARAQRIVAEFRADCARAIDTPEVARLVDELSAASKAFDQWWRLRDVMEREGGERRFHHPRHGELVFDQLTLHPAPRDGLKLVMLLPAA
jgi:transcriptional regulator with XRE-family HTH domain